MPRQDRTGWVGWAVGLTLIGLLIIGAWWWRQSEPRRPSFALAEESLKQFERWRKGELPPTPEGLVRFSELKGWLARHPTPLPSTSGAEGGTLALSGPMPSMAMAIDGVEVVQVINQPAAMLRLGDGTHKALLFVFDVSAGGLLGYQERRLLDEWNHYAFNAGEARLVVWRRKGNLFSVVTTEDLGMGSAGDDILGWLGRLFDDETVPLNRPLWLPPPTTRRPMEDGQPQAVYATPGAQGVAAPAAGQQTPPGSPVPTASPSDGVLQPQE